MRNWLLSLCATFLILSAEGANAFPDRPITVINTNAAGNTGDIAFRIIQPILEKKLGQRVVLINKPGASGEIAVGEVARSTPDGYTLLLAPNNNYVTNQFILPGGKANPLDAIDPITTISSGYSVIVVPATMKVANLKEFKALAEEEPGKLNYASPGIGTTPHLAGAAFAKLANVKMVHVAYKGSPAVMEALMRGDVQLYFSVLSAVKGYVSAEKLKALAVAAPQRLDALPGVPTTAEAGFPSLISSSWWALAAPKGTDPKKLETITEAVQFAFRDAAVLQRFNQLDIGSGGLASKELKDQIKQETHFWKDVISSLGLSPL